MLLHADNFNYYGTDEANLLDGVYAEYDAVALVADPDGISPARVLEYAFSNTNRLRWVLPAAHATVGVSQRVWLEHLPNNDSRKPRIVEWRDGSNNVIACIQINTTGGLEFVNGPDDNNPSAATAASAGPAMTASGWYHIESKLHCAGALGATVEVRVEGLPVITYDGFSTSANTCAQLRFRTFGTDSSGLTTWYQKDLVVWDGSGTQNNDFMGSVIVYELFTTADVTLGGWTSTGANGYSVLDNDPPQDNVQYLSADATPPAACEFTLTNLPDDVSSVKGIVTRVRAAKTDGGDGQLKVGLRSNGSDDYGADRPITVAQTYWSDVSEDDPDTDAAWVPGAVNNATLVLDRTV